MHHAVVLATDLGEGLRPLTNEATPIAFLPLGDRRPLLRQWSDLLMGLSFLENVWVVVGAGFRASAEALLPASVRVVASLAEFAPCGGGQAVLLQPAEQMIGDVSSYERIISAGLDRAAHDGHPVVFAVRSAERVACPTGIEARPWKHLVQNLDGDGELSRLSGQAATVSMDAAGWIDLTSWVGVRRLLGFVEKPWGHEHLWALNRHYAGKVLFIRAGESLSLQYHEDKDETIRITSGRMRLRVGPSPETLETLELEPGMAYPIPPRCVHRMEALEDCTVIEVSTPQLTDVVRLEDGYGRA